MTLRLGKLILSSPSEDAVFKRFVGRMVLLSRSGISNMKSLRKSMGPGPGQGQGPKRNTTLTS